MAHKYMNVVSVKKNGFNNLKTNKIMKQTAVEWFVDLFKDEPRFLNEFSLDIKQAKEMEKQQQDELAIGFFDWFNSKQAEDLMHDLVIVGEVDINTTTKELLEIYKKEKGL